MADSTESGGGTRTCPKCGETKPTSAFSRSSATKHGFQSRCKECKKAEARAGYDANPEKHRAYSRAKMAERREGEDVWVEVVCSDCGKTWLKRKDTLNKWKGRCHSCAGIETLSDPAIRAMLAEKAKLQIEAWGGRIPNSQRWGIEKPIRGEDHPRWKGGVTSENRRERSTAEYVVWRNAVFARDDYTCQICEQRGYELNAHHIRSWMDYPELRFDVTNGVTLCREWGSIPLRGGMADRRFVTGRWLWWRNRDRVTQELIAVLEDRRRPGSDPMARWPDGDLESFVAKAAREGEPYPRYDDLRNQVPEADGDQVAVGPILFWSDPDWRRDQIKELVAARKGAKADSRVVGWLARLVERLIGLPPY